MDHNKPTGTFSSNPVLYAGESNADYRARIAARQADALARRQGELLDQRSTRYTPTTRIRMWERLHQVNLPRNAEHRLVDVIAAQTGLTAEDVREEQRLRANPPVAGVVGAGAELAAGGADASG